MMKLKSVFCAAVLAISISSAIAQETVKIGLLTTYSGPIGGHAGEMVDQVINTWQKRYGDTIGDKKIEIVKRDTTGPNPEIAKRLTQELVYREKVQLLIGPDFTPNALAVASLVTEAKIPTFLHAVATEGVVKKSPYFIRTFSTIPQTVRPAADRALKEGLKKVVTIVANYGPGLDAERVFAETYAKAGLTVAEQIRVPVKNPDFSSYIQRLRDARADGFYVYLLSGEMTIQFMRAYTASGLRDTKLKMIATADLTDECCLAAQGDSMLGVVSVGVYSPAHDSSVNNAFVKDHLAANGKDADISLLNVCVWDSLEIIRAGLLAQKGSKFDSDKFMQAIHGKTFESPRGPIKIEADGEITQDVYFRKVERKDGKLMNIEFETIKAVKG